MLKKTITYTSLFTDEPVTEDYYFHISKADLVAMEMEEHRAVYEKDGEKLTGMQAKLQRIVDSQDGKAIMAEFRDIIRRAYGKKDGDRFLKSPEISEEFLSSEAYSELIYEICTDANKAGEFVNGIIPGNIEQIAAEVKREAEELEAQEQEQKPSSTMDALESASKTLGEGDPTVRTLTNEEIRSMDPAELQAGLADGRYKLS